MEFRIINKEYDSYTQLPENIDSISILIDFNDSKRILKTTFNSKKNYSNPRHRIGILVFKNGSKRKIRIQKYGFVDLSDNNRYYSFKNVDRNVIEEWNTYLLRVSKEVKDSTILAFNKITNDSTYKINIKGKYITSYFFYDSYFDVFDFLYYNLTNEEINRFSESENVILNAAAFFIKVYRNYDAKYTRNNLLKLAKNNNKQVKYQKFGLETIKLGEFCFKVLIQEKDSPIHLLSEKEINQLRKKVIKH